MPDETETEVVWQSMPGAQPLFGTYGYWPTLHDAVVRAFEIVFADRSVEIVLDYADLVGDAGSEADVGTRMTLRWSNVIEASLRLYAGNLYGVAFARTPGGIETRFTDYTWGMDGRILSAAIEVVNVAPSPGRSEKYPNDPVDHDIRIALK